MSFAIVTDSTSDMPEDIRKANNIHVVPLYITFGTESFKDGETITSNDFYQKLVTSSVHPMTSQPTMADFVEAYKQAREEANADSVLAIVVSSEVSGTYNSAIQAKDQVDFPVEVVDSRIASIPLTFLAMEAAEARDAGKSFEETVALIRAKVDDVAIFFTVATLEYLHRGGRIGGAAKFFGEALKIKPILRALDGIIQPVDRVRTAKKAMAKLIELTKEDIGDRKLKRLGILEAQSPEEVEQLKAAIADWFDGEIIVFRAGTAVGTHAGPGLYGLGYEVE